MKLTKHIGLAIFLLGLAIFSGSIFLGNFSMTDTQLDEYISEQGIKSDIFSKELKKTLVTEEQVNIFEFSSAVRKALETSNNYYDKQIAKYNAEKNWAKKGEQYQYKIHGKPHTISYNLAKKAGSGFVKENIALMWWLTFGLGIIGALLYILPNISLLGPPGIKNNGIYHKEEDNNNNCQLLHLEFECKLNPISVGGRH